MGVKLNSLAAIASLAIAFASSAFSRWWLEDLNGAPPGQVESKSPSFALKAASAVAVVAVVIAFASGPPWLIAVIAIIVVVGVASLELKRLIYLGLFKVAKPVRLAVLALWVLTAIGIAYFFGHTTHERIATQPGAAADVEPLRGSIPYGPSALRRG